MDITARLRPMNIGDMFDAAFRLYRAHFLTFIGIVVPLLTSFPYVAATVTAGLVAVIANPLPYKLGLMLAALAGIVVGVVLDIRKRGINAPAQEPAEERQP